MRPPRAILAPLFVTASAAACTFPHPDAKLPEPPYVAVLSGQMPAPIDEVARHSWIVVQPLHKHSHRYEYGSGYGLDPFNDFAAGDVQLHGVVTGTPAEIAALDACLDKAETAYYRVHPDYFPIPGPNSNTFVATLDRRCGLGVELPATAIGRDYVGPVGAAVTEAGTGIELESIPFGIRVGVREGVSVQIFGLALGVHLLPPGIDVPVNPGRIGFSTEDHAYRVPERRWHDAFPDKASVDAAASTELYASGYGVVDPKRAAGLDAIGLVGISGRAVYGHYVGYAVGGDLEIGAFIPAGFAGTARLYPVGVGAMLGQTGFVAVFGGIGASGVAGLLPTGLEVPLEERVEFDVGPHARLGAFARQNFTALDPRRALGLYGLGESDFGLRARFGDSRAFQGGRSGLGAFGSGPFFGFERRELSGTSMLGFVLGTELDFGLTRGKLRYVEHLARDE